MKTSNDESQLYDFSHMQQLMGSVLAGIQLSNFDLFTFILTVSNDKQNLSFEFCTNIQ